ncbi:hypothetical protein HaLaN_27105 [Haematococcus lacustris]|uniref:Uncharacterized protein n=1 Tax=Haematococcus lacustris TaxID=44745 RepID=A0A6A0A7G7_HAELA|nr:hypothetical protein HaLaN_27105 [Haematococcus lacustris]
MSVKTATTFSSPLGKLVVPCAAKQALGVGCFCQGRSQTAHQVWELHAPPSLAWVGVVLCPAADCGPLLLPRLITRQHLGPQPRAWSLPWYTNRGPLQNGVFATAATGPWVACLAPACSPGLGTPCPWLAELPPLASSTPPVGATCSPHCAACSMLHCSPCLPTCLVVVLVWLWPPCPCSTQLPAQPWWAGWAQLPAQPLCAWLVG